MVRTAKIKICGITNRKDAEKLAQLDIDALGFIVTEKEIPSRISVEEAKKIISNLPPFIISVLGLGGLGISEVVSLCEEIKPDSVQIQYGLDSANELRELKKKMPWVSVIKTIQIDLENPDEKRALIEAKEFAGVSDALLVHPAMRKHKKIDLEKYWKLAAKIVGLSSKPVILAGKLNAQNVVRAVKIVKPYAIDLLSGVETTPGKKDFKKVEELIKVVREAKI